MDWLEVLLVYGILLIIMIGFLNTVFAQEAASGVNDAFGGVTENLRVWLDGMKGVEDFFGHLSCHFMGLFTGYDNLPEGSICI